MVEKKITGHTDTQKLRLQAYERITMLAERISIHNVISRTSSAGLNYRQMQQVLMEEIKQEYEYNISQQVYISNELWKAITNLKDQNIYIVNQAASSMAPQASGLDLVKRILDFVMNNPKSELHNLVLEAINFEAKNIM